MKTKVLLVLAFFVIFARSVYAQKEGHDLKDFRGIIHLHSELSHDSNGKFENIVKAAEKRKIDFVVMTDHWSPELYEKSPRGMFGNTLFIPGVEISKHKSFSILAFPLPKDFIPHDYWLWNVLTLGWRGAFVFVGHLELASINDIEPLFDGLELTNLHALALPKSVFGIAGNYFEALLPWNWDLGFLVKEEKIAHNISKWLALELERNDVVPIMAGNDSHDNFRLFKFFGPKLASYERTLGFATTHVFAEELSESAVLEAIGRGRSYVAFEALGESDGFKFVIHEEWSGFGGGKVYLSGDEVKHKDNLEISIILPQLMRGPRDKKFVMRVLRNGEVIYQSAGFGSILFDMRVPSPGLYRVEFLIGGKSWILSNSILVK